MVQKIRAKENNSFFFTKTSISYNEDSGLMDTIFFSYRSQNELFPEVGVKSGRSIIGDEHTSHGMTSCKFTILSAKLFRSNVAEQPREGKLK